MHKFRLLLQIGVLGFTGSVIAADDEGPGSKLLATLDTNGDELISLVEFQAQDSMAALEMDTDQNGVLTLDEFINARPNMGMRPERGNRAGDGQRQPSDEQVARMQEMRTQRATERFTAMDTDGDEIVTLAEFQAGMFTELDENDDGVLEASELRPERRGRPGPGGRGGDGPRGGRSTDINQEA